MNITDPKVLKLKGMLFLVLGLMSAGVLLLNVPDWKILLLLTICIWAFCRFYYFAFYVLHHYADRSFQYSGLWDLARYLVTKRNR